MKIYFFNFIDRLISVCCHKKNIQNNSIQYQQINNAKIIDLKTKDNEKIKENNS